MVKNETVLKKIQDKTKLLNYITEVKSTGLGIC